MIKINERKARFVHLLLDGKTEIEAYKGAYDNNYNDTKIRFYIRKLMTDENVLAYMDSVLEERKQMVTVDPAFVIKHLKKTVLEKPNTTVAVRSLELLGKYLAMWVDKQVVEERTSQKDLADEVWERRQALERGEEVAPLKEIKEESTRIPNVIEFSIKKDDEDDGDEERRFGTS